MCEMWSVEVASGETELVQYSVVDRHIEFTWELRFRVTFT